MEIGLIICPPTSFLDRRTGASEKICSTPRKPFFNSIGHKPPRRFVPVVAAVPSIGDTECPRSRMRPSSPLKASPATTTVMSATTRTAREIPMTTRLHGGGWCAHPCQQRSARRVRGIGRGQESSHSFNFTSRAKQKETHHRSWRVAQMSAQMMATPPPAPQGHPTTMYAYRRTTRSIAAEACAPSALLNIGNSATASMNAATQPPHRLDLAVQVWP